MTEQHRVTWDAGQPTFHCDGDITSACHSFPDCECEVWPEGHAELHPFVAHEKECWVLPWLENIEVECTWEGGEGDKRPEEHDATISTVWEEGQIIWDYADPELALPVAS